MVYNKKEYYGISCLRCANRAHLPAFYHLILRRLWESCDRFLDAAVAMIGIPAADNMDGSASIKAVKPIQSNAGIVDRFVWRKNL